MLQAQSAGAWQGPTIYRHTCTFEGIRAFSVVGRVWSLQLVVGLGGTCPAVPQTKVAIVIPGVRWGGTFPSLTCSRCVTTVEFVNSPMVSIQVFDDDLWVDAGVEEPTFLQAGVLKRAVSGPRAARGEKGLATSASPPKVYVKNNYGV